MIHSRVQQRPTLTSGVMPTWPAKILYLNYQHNFLENLVLFCVSANNIFFTFKLCIPCLHNNCTQQKILKPSDPVWKEYI